MQTNLQPSWATMVAFRAVLLILLFTAGCAGQPSSTTPASSAPSQASQASSSGECKIDSAKICADAQAAGTLEQGPPMGYGGPPMVDTARVAIPNGQTIQAMCYLDPQHKTISR